MMRRLIVSGGVGVLGVLMLMGSDAGAVINSEIELQGDEFQISISPAYFEAELVPGTVTRERVRVRNVGSRETQLRIGLVPLRFSDETTTLGTPRNEIIDWTTIALEPSCEATKIDAATGAIFVRMRVKEECFVGFSVKTPAVAPYGEQYMDLIFEEYNEGTDGSLQMRRAMTTSIFGTNRTGGGANDACSKVTDQAIPFWLFDGPLEATVKVENCGRLNFRAASQIEVRNLFGAVVYEDNTPADGRIIAAESRRVVSTAWESAKIGIYKTKQTVVALGETYVSERWTFIIPVWLIVVVSGCLLVAILAFLHGRNKKKRMRNVRR